MCHREALARHADAVKGWIHLNNAWRAFCIKCAHNFRYETRSVYAEDARGGAGWPAPRGGKESFRVRQRPRAEGGARSTGGRGDAVTRKGGGECRRVARKAGCRAGETRAGAWSHGTDEYLRRGDGDPAPGREANGRTQG